MLQSERDPARDGASYATRTMRALELLSSRDSSVPQLARYLGSHARTVRRLLTELTAGGYITPVEGYRRRYRTSLRLAALGRQVLAREPLPRAAAPWVATLAAQTGQSASLWIPCFSNVVCLLQGDPLGPPPEPMLGALAPAHASAAGKALLAHRGPWRESILTQPLPRYTPRTLTDPVSLTADLDRIRALFFSVRGVLLACAGRWAVVGRGGLLALASRSGRRVGRLLGGVVVGSREDDRGGGRRGARYVGGASRCGRVRTLRRGEVALAVCAFADATLIGGVGAMSAAFRRPFRATRERSARIVEGERRRRVGGQREFVGASRAPGRAHGRSLADIRLAVLMLDAIELKGAAASSAWASRPTASRSRSGCGTVAEQDRHRAPALRLVAAGWMSSRACRRPRRIQGAAARSRRCSAPCRCSAASVTKSETCSSTSPSATAPPSSTLRRAWATDDHMLALDACRRSPRWALPPRRRQLAARGRRPSLSPACRSARLKRTLQSTNPIESMIEIVRAPPQRQALQSARCACAGPPPVLEAEQQFRNQKYKKNSRAEAMRLKAASTRHAAARSRYLCLSTAIRSQHLP